MTQIQRPHQIRSRRPPKGSASERRTLEREGANLCDGILKENNQ